jgi:hypothetical protein
VLSARRSAQAVYKSRNRRPAQPIVVALAGTDVYRDIHTDRPAQGMRRFSILQRVVLLRAGVCAGQTGLGAIIGLVTGPAAAVASGFRLDARREAMIMTRCATLLLGLLLTLASCWAADVRWSQLSSKRGELPEPGGSTQQTGLLVANLDKTKAAGFVISYRVEGPALVWYRRSGNGWTRYVIENEFLPLEAGGATYDIDGDGDLDVVFGGDSRDNHLWWWENPYPNFDPEVSWKRHVIKETGANQHHDQTFADLLGLGKAQLIFWNQAAKTLFLAAVPADPKSAGPWPLQQLFSGQAGENVEDAAKYAEGLHAFDVDGDGRADLLAGNCWFKYEGGGKFRPVRVGTIGGRIMAGKFKPGKVAQIVIAPGDGNGPLRFYECKGDPADAKSWTGRDLLDRNVIHGHTLDVGDIDGDGNLDIFVAEMAKWTNNPQPDNPAATAWILYGDGKGGFRGTVLVTGHGWHEGKLADVDGDGDLDIINKPYTWDAPRVDVWINHGSIPGRSPRSRQLHSFRGVPVVPEKVLFAAGPKCGDVHREFYVAVSRDREWRVTDPQPEHKGAFAFPRNPVVPLPVSTLAGRRAELLIDRWAGWASRLRPAMNVAARPTSSASTPPGTGSVLAITSGGWGLCCRRRTARAKFGAWIHQSEPRAGLRRGPSART